MGITIFRKIGFKNHLSSEKRRSPFGYHLSPMRQFRRKQHRIAMRCFGVEVEMLRLLGDEADQVIGECVVPCPVTD